MQTLGDLGEVVSGGTPSRTVPSFWNGSIPWATPTDITRLQNKYISTTAEKITKNGLEGSSAHLLPAGSLLVTSRATLGEAAIATVPIATNQGFKSIVPNAETHRVFAYYLVKTLKPKMLPLASGTTFLEIGKGDFCRIPVRIPDFDEQSRIAYVLDTIDEAIQKTEAVIAKLKQIRAGMLHDLLTYGLDKDGKLRDPVAHPEQFKDSELGRIPKEWEVVSLGDALSMQAGDFLSSERIASNGDYPVYGGNGIRGYTSIFNTEGPLVLIGRQGALCGNVLIASGRFYATEHAIVVRPRTEMDVHWLAAYLTRMDLNRYSESSAQPGLSVNKLSYRFMIRPPFPEQSMIGSALVGVRLRLKAEQAELHKFQMIKSGLMDDLLSGNVPVPENIEANEEALND